MFHILPSSCFFFVLFCFFFWVGNTILQFQIDSFILMQILQKSICNQLIVNQSYIFCYLHSYVYHVIETFMFQAVEVKFTLSEFVTCYKRLMGLNLEGFSEFVNRTLEALISTSMMVHKTMTTDKRKCSHTNQVKIFENSQCCQLPFFYVMISSLLGSY